MQGITESPYEDAGMMAKQASNQLGGRQTRRDRLNYQRSQLQQSLNAVDKAIAALDAHPELEEFIETLARAGA